MSIKKKNKSSIKVYSNFEDENIAEHRRLAFMTPQERWDEFAVLQERVWGTLWTSKSIKKIASFEILKW